MEKCATCQHSFSARNCPNNVLKCSFCAKYYHGECQNIKDAGIIKYIRSGVQNLWNCIDCEQKRELVLTFASKFDEIRNMFSEQQKSVADLADLVKNQGEDLRNMRLEMQNSATRPGTPTVKRSFADVINTQLCALSVPSKKQKVKNSTVQHKKNPKSKDRVIVIQHVLGEDCSSDIENSLKKELNPLKDPVFGMRKTSKNKVVIHCKDESAFVTYKERISAKLGEDFVVDKPRERKYRLKFVDIPKEIEKEQLLTCISEQNNCIDLVQHLSVKRITDNIAYMECDNEDTYKLLLSKKKVLVLWNVVRIQPYVNLRRCYCCQQFGHTFMECDIMVNDRACPKCAGEHDITKCVSDAVCCINCQRENKSTGSSNPTDHFAWSGKCPVVLNEIRRIEAKNKA